MQSTLFSPFWFSKDLSSSILFCNNIYNNQKLVLQIIVTLRCFVIVVGQQLLFNWPLTVFHYFRDCFRFASMCTVLLLHCNQITRLYSLLSLQTGTFEAGTKGPCNSDVHLIESSIKAVPSKERQGSTLGVCFIKVSILQRCPLRESRLYNIIVKSYLQAIHIIPSLCTVYICPIKEQ